MRLAIIAGMILIAKSIGAYTGWEPTFDDMLLACTAIIFGIWLDIAGANSI